MDSVHYEELCRRYVADNFGVPLESVETRHVPNPTRPGRPEFKHQVDLLWEKGDDFALYLHIANAKWRTDRKIEQGEVMLLQQVRQRVGAHKAIMLTSVGFTEGAVAAAADDGIGLHVVQPAVDLGAIATTERVAVRAALADMAAAAPSRLLYNFTVVCRGIQGAPGVFHDPTAVIAPRPPVGGIVNRGPAVMPVVNRGPASMPIVNRASTSFVHKGGGGGLGGHGGGFRRG